MNYILITPVKNEQQFIRQTIESVITQTELPLAWVIIDGGSSDKTRNIVKEYTAKYPWIYLRHQLGFSDKGGHINVSIAMNEAYEYLKQSGIPFDYVANIDADQVLSNDFFRGIIWEMMQDQTIGVATGQAYNPDGKPDTYPPGDINNKRIYRRTALDESGGYPTSKYSFDTVILAKIRMNNWNVATFKEYPIQNLRKDMGIEHSSTIKSNIQWGRSKYYLGYSLSLLLAGCGYLIIKGEFSKSVGVFIGYMQSWSEHTEVIDDMQVWEYYHNQRLMELLIG